MPGAGVGAGIGLLAVLSRDDPPARHARGGGHGRSCHHGMHGRIRLAEAVVSGRCGVALIGAATVPGSVADLTARLRQQFPDLVLVVAGGLEHQGQLAAQITSGEVYRFCTSRCRRSACGCSSRRRCDVRRGRTRRSVARRVASRRVKSRTRVAMAPRARSVAAAGSVGGTPPAGAAADRRAGRGRCAGGRGWAVVRAAWLGCARAVFDAGAGGEPGGGRVDGRDAGNEPRRPRRCSTKGEKNLARAANWCRRTARAADLFGQVLKKIPAQPQATAEHGQKVVNALLRARGRRSSRQNSTTQRATSRSAKTLQPDNVRIAFLLTQLGKERERVLLTKARQAAASGDLGKALAVLGSGNDAASATPRWWRRRGIAGGATRSMNGCAGCLRLGNERLRSGADGTDQRQLALLPRKRAGAGAAAGRAAAVGPAGAKALTEARAAGGAATRRRPIRRSAAPPTWAFTTSDLDPLRAQLASSPDQFARRRGRPAVGAGVTNASARAACWNRRTTGGFASTRWSRPPISRRWPRCAPLGRAMLGGRVTRSAAATSSARSAWLAEAETVGMTAADLAPLNAELAAARDKLRVRSQVVGVGSLKACVRWNRSYPREAKEKERPGLGRHGIHRDPGARSATSRSRARSRRRCSTSRRSGPQQRWRFEPVRRDGAAVDQQARGCACGFESVRAAITPVALPAPPATDTLHGGTDHHREQRPGVHTWLERFVCAVQPYSELRGDHRAPAGQRPAAWPCRRPARRYTAAPPFGTGGRSRLRGLAILRRLRPSADRPVTVAIAEQGNRLTAIAAAAVAPRDYLRACSLRPGSSTRC